MHDLTKVAMGGVYSSRKEVTEHDADPATFIAGLAVRKTSSGYSLTSGLWIGLSLGKSLTDEDLTAICRTGLRVPIQITPKAAYGEVTISNFANLVLVTPDTIEVAGVVFTAQAGASTPGDATFQAATSNDATASDLADQINAHATAGALVTAVANAAVVEITANAADDTGNDLTLAYVDNNAPTVGASVSGATLSGGGLETDYVVKGDLVYIDDVTAKANDPAETVTVSAAIYRSNVLKGIQEDGTEIYAALVDIVGGL